MNAIVEHRPNLTAGGKVSAIVPQTMDEAYRLSKAICMAGMAPKGLDTPEKAMVAIMHGMEIGLTPMRALQTIAVVNGRPTLWGDGVIGLVRGSGACEWVKETVEGKDDTRIAICETKRKGEPHTVRRTFSVTDAKKAGLWGKQGPWQQYPERMLSVRARAFALRDGFADVLGGLYLKEEIDDIPGSARDVVPKRPPMPEPVMIANEVVQAARPPLPAIVAAPADPVSEPLRPDEIISEFDEAASVAGDISTLNEAWADLVAPVFERLDGEWQTQLQTILDQRRALLEMVQ